MSVEAAYKEYQKALANPNHPMHQYMPLVRQASQKYGVPEHYMVATLFNESRFNPKAVPKDEKGNPYAWDANAGRGIAQFTPGTGRGYGLTITAEQDDRMDPNKAIDAMGRFAADNYKRANGDTTAMVNLYFSGKKRLEDMPAKFRPTAQNYAGFVNAVKNGYVAPPIAAPTPMGDMFNNAILNGTSAEVPEQRAVKPEALAFDLYPKIATEKPARSDTIPKYKDANFADILRQSYGYFGQKPLI